MIFIVKSIKKGEVMHSYFQENSMMKYLGAFNFNFYSTRLYLISMIVYGQNLQIVVIFYQKLWLPDSIHSIVQSHILSPFNFIILSLKIPGVPLTKSILFARSRGTRKKMLVKVVTSWGPTCLAWLQPI